MRSISSSSKVNHVLLGSTTAARISSSPSSACSLKSLLKSLELPSLPPISRLTIPLIGCGGSSIAWFWSNLVLTQLSVLPAPGDSSYYDDEFTRYKYHGSRPKPITELKPGPTKTKQSVWFWSDLVLTQLSVFDHGRGPTKKR